MIDSGWLRLLGGGYAGLPDLAAANGLGEPSVDSSPPPFLIVGHDVLGGRFAIDGGALRGSAGEVCYFSPDLLTWEGLDIGHGDFVRAMIGGATRDFYASVRWDGWEAECEGLPLDHGFSLYPPPFSAQGVEVSAVSRREVPLAELFYFYEEAARQLG